MIVSEPSAGCMMYGPIYPIHPMYPIYPKLPCKAELQIGGVVECGTPAIEQFNKTSCLVRGGGAQQIYTRGYQWDGNDGWVLVSGRVTLIAGIIWSFTTSILAKGFLRFYCVTAITDLHVTGPLHALHV